MEISYANINLDNLSVTGEYKFDRKLDVTAAEQKFLIIDAQKADITLDNLSPAGQAKFDEKADHQEVADAVSAHDDSMTAHEELFDRTAKLDDLILPRESVVYEPIHVGSARELKDLPAAFVYMNSKTMGRNKGFDVILDPGAYSPVVFEKSLIRLRSADPDNRAVIGFGAGALEFVQNSYVEMSDVDIHAKFNVSQMSTAIMTNVYVSISEEGQAVNCQAGSYLRMSDCEVRKTGSQGLAGVFIAMSNAQISGSTLANFKYGLQVRYNSYLHMSAPLNTVADCEFGALLQLGANARMQPEAIAFHNCTYNTSPSALDTVANQNSYISTR